MREILKQLKPALVLILEQELQCKYSTSAASING